MLQLQQPLGTSQVNNKPSTSQSNQQSDVNQNQTNNNNTNTYLKSLILDIEGISPEFNKETTEYYLIVDLNVDKIEVNAIPEDDTSEVEITGNEDLEEGENKIIITVKSQNGSKRTYTINVTKTDDVEMTNANLKSLTVKGFDIYPSFKNNIYSYNIVINEKISRLDVIAETENEEAKVEIIGNENLKVGDNIIKITVTAKNGSTIKEYKINVFMYSEETKDRGNEKIQGIITLCVLTFGIVVTIIMIANKK